MGRALAFSAAVVGIAAFAQDTRVIRWHDADPNSNRTVRAGVVAKQVVAGRISVTAQLIDRGDSFRLRLEVSNDGSTPFDVRPELVQLQAVRPRSTLLSPIAADTLAKAVRRSADRRAAGIEGLASVATTTVHEQVPTIVTSFNPASVLDPSQPTTVTTMGTETVVKTVPDDAARSRAQIEAQDIRRRAAAEARQILGSALTAVQLAHGSRVEGALYFDTQDDLTEALVVVRVGAVTVEIPFTAIERRSLLGRGTLTFR